MSADERDFLDDDVAGEVEQETPESPEPETPEPEAETVEKPAETPEPEVPTTPEAKEEKTVPYAAMKAEREKRQRLERELEELRAKPQEEPGSFYEDPEKYLQHAVRTVEHQATQRMYQALEAQARETFEDYDEVFEEVKEHAASNPAVAQQIFTAPNPAVAAYKLGKQLREFKQMQDPDAYRQKVRAEVRAELEAELAAKDAAKAKAAAAIPPDLTDSRNAKGADLPAPGTVFDEIF